MLEARAEVRNKTRSLCKIVLRLSKFHVIDADLATAIVYFNL